MTRDESRGDTKPGKGLFGWLGRQVGYVAHAVRHDPAVVAKAERVEEKTDPDHPGVVFRRTVTDEVRLVPADQGSSSSTPTLTSGRDSGAMD